MLDFLSSWLIAFSFFTILPLPSVEWTTRRLKYVPLLMPLVGVLIGSAGYLLFRWLMFSGLADLTKAVLMTLFYLVSTGGLHMDGLMDTADAYFSRADREKKLEIMRDSRVGAFGVMVLIGVLLLKICCFLEIYRTQEHAVLLFVPIPVLSRTVQALMLCLCPSARNEGLAVAFKAGTGKGTCFFLSLYAVLTSLIVFYLAGAKGLLLPGGLLILSIVYYFSSQKNFGGITGDIVGGFVELAELLMLVILVLSPL